MIALLVVSVGVLVYMMNLQPTPVQPEPPQIQAVEAPEPVEKPTLSVEELFELTNAERAKAGVKPLELDERLNQSAQRKAEIMVAENRFSHIDNDGVHGYEYIYDYIQCEYASENITDNVYVNSSKSAINAWMNSELHREAILDSDYELVGFGVEETKVVQHFCDLD